jgi:hypothetical protein
MSRKNKSTMLRVKLRGIELSPAARKKLESDIFYFVVQLFYYCFDHHVAFPDGDALTFPTIRGYFVTSSLGRAKSKEERQKKILREIGRPVVLDMLQFCAKNEIERANIEKAKLAYEKAVFGKFRSQKRRTASEFLWRWRSAEMYDRESRPAELMSLIMPDRKGLLAVYLGALNAGDAEFLEGVAEAMRRSRSERANVRKRLIEIDHLVHPTGPIPHWKDIWQKHCPDHKDSPQNFQHLLDGCGIRYDKGVWRGNKTKCVQKPQKNTHSRVCARMMTDHKSRRDRNNAENGSRPRR